MNAERAREAPASTVHQEMQALAATLRGITVQVRGRGPGGGSGVIWRADGLIVTNAHVARGRQTEVELPDGRTLKASVKARDPELDLALLSVDASGLPAAEIGESTQLKVGELVFAAGHPNGVNGAVTAGIVHDASGPRSGDRWLVADLRLAPGNSGGPLADARGRVVGINSMIARGLAVAIPSRVVQEFIARPHAAPVLGVSVQPVAVHGTERRTLGLMVLEVTPRGAAESAGLLLGDVLLGAGGRRFEAPGDLRRSVQDAAASRSIELDLIRAGKTLRLRAALPSTSLAEAA